MNNLSNANTSPQAEASSPLLPEEKQNGFMNETPTAQTNESSTKTGRAFSKKPVVIEAVQFDGTPGGAVKVFDQFDIPGAKFVPESDFTTGRIVIPTLEGLITASANDWIIKGVKGEFYPCKPDIFEATYERVESEFPRPPAAYRYEN